MRNQPPSRKTSALASGRFQYPLKIDRPRTQSSPVSPGFTGRPSSLRMVVSRQGAAKPTLPLSYIMSSSGRTQVPRPISVIPKASHAIVPKRLRKVRQVSGGQPKVATCFRRVADSRGSSGCRVIKSGNMHHSI